MSPLIRAKERLNEARLRITLGHEPVPSLKECAELTRAYAAYEKQASKFKKLLEAA